MLGSFPVALIAGAVFGFLAGLGIGGGSLLMIWLTLLVGVAPQEARAINLLFFLPAALSACLFRWKQGQLPLKKLLLPMLLGCIFAAGFSFLGSRLDTGLLKKLFGGLLIFTGIRELLYRPREFK